MAKYANVTVFENFDDVSDRLSRSLKLYGCKEGGSVYKTSEGKLEIAIVGKLPATVASLISLETGELVGDYEGIDDATKKTGYVFPVEKCKQLMVDCLGYEGRFVEVPTEEQDPISGEIKKELLYVQRDKADEPLADLVSEYIESAINMVDSSDDAESVAQVMFETFNQILDLTGNSNLQSEVNQRLLDILG